MGSQRVRAKKQIHGATAKGVRQIHTAVRSSSNSHIQQSRTNWRNARIPISQMRQLRCHEAEAQGQTRQIVHSHSRVADQGLRLEPRWSGSSSSSLPLSPLSLFLCLLPLSFLLSPIAVVQRLPLMAFKSFHNTQILELNIYSQSQINRLLGFFFFFSFFISLKISGEKQLSSGKMASRCHQEPRPSVICYSAFIMFFYPQHLVVAAVVPAISCARGRKEEGLGQNDFSLCPLPSCFHPIPHQGCLLISLDFQVISGETFQLGICPRNPFLRKKGRQNNEQASSIPCCHINLLRMGWPRGSHQQVMLSPDTGVVGKSPASLQSQFSARLVVAENLWFGELVRMGFYIECPPIELYSLLSLMTSCDFPPQILFDVLSSAKLCVGNLVWELKNSSLSFACFVTCCCANMKMLSLSFLILYSLEMCKNNSTCFIAQKNYMGLQAAVTSQDCSKLIFIFDHIPFSPLFCVFFFFFHLSTHYLE